MRAWTLKSLGGRAALELRDAAAPQPGPGQLLVRVRAAGLNRGEILGAGAAPKPAGMEAAGEVTRLGAGATQFKAGDRVMGRCPHFCPMPN